MNVVCSEGVKDSRILNYTKIFSFANSFVWRLVVLIFCEVLFISKEKLLSLFGLCIEFQILITVYELKSAYNFEQNNCT